MYQMSTDKQKFIDFIKWLLVSWVSGLKTTWYKLYKRKVTLSQFTEGLLFLGYKQSDLLFKKMIKHESFSSEIKNQYEWEIFYFTFASIYIMLASLPGVIRRTEIMSKYLELYQNMMDKGFPENAKSLYEELLKRIDLYKIAWRIEGDSFKSTGQLLLNLLFMIGTAQNRNDFIKGYVSNAESSDENLRKYYTRSWFPTAHGMKLILESLACLASCVNFSIKQFDIVD
jgi:hypothetical protein